MSSFTPNSVVSLNGEKRRLRIAVFNRTFSAIGGGAERYSVALVEQLAAKHDIHVFAQEIFHNWPGVTYHRVSMPMRKPRWINQLWFATRTWWLTRTGFDIVHSHENTWHGNVQTVHVLPVKHTLFNGLQGWSYVLKWLKVATSPRLLAYLGLERSRFSFHSNRKVVVTSESLRKIMASTYPDSARMISVITPGITLPTLTMATSEKENARSQLGLPQEGSCILFVANNYRKKGLKTLLAALNQCKAEFFLIVVGNLSDKPIFAEQIKLLNLESRVFFLGSLNDVAPAYQAADCLAHPTLEDTFAMVVLEGMSYGLPVVVSSSKYCGISGLLRNGENALIIDDPLNASHLKNALEKVLTQPSFRSHLIKGATAFASSYQWNTLALQQEAIYAESAEH